MVYTLADHAALEGPLRPLFDELRKRIQNLDAGVLEEVRKQYIAYRFSSNFVEVVPQVNELKLYLDISIDELDDPAGLGRDVTKIGRWGTGGVEARLTTVDQLEGVMSLVRQSFERQAEEGAEAPQWSQAGVERVAGQASDPAIRAAVLALVEAAVGVGLYPRPWKRSVMFAPPANRSRSLFTVSIRADDRVDLWCAAEAFQFFYGLDPASVERLLGPAGPTALYARDVESLVGRLEELMADAVDVRSIGSPIPGDREDWDWDRYASELRVPSDRLEIGRTLVAALEKAATARGLPWHVVFRKGYVAIQRAGGFNVALVDVYWNDAPRFAVKIPGDPNALGIANPYPSLKTSWQSSQFEWGWHVPSLDALPDVAVALDLAAPYHPASGNWKRPS